MWLNNNFPHIAIQLVSSFATFLGDSLKLKLSDDALKESRPRGDVLKEPPDGGRQFTVGAQGLRPCHWSNYFQITLIWFA